MPKTKHTSRLARFGFIAVFAPMMWIELFRDVGEDWRVYAWSVLDLVALALGLVLWIGAIAGITSIIDGLLTAVGL